MKALLVAFDAAETAASKAFFHALGMPWDVIVVPNDALSDSASTAIAEAASGYSVIAAVSSMRSKDVMARVAGVLDAGMVTDVTGIKSPTMFERPIVAGTIVATVEVLGDVTVLTFRPSSFSEGDSTPGSSRELAVSEGMARRISVDVRGGSRPDLTQAKRIVSGGRPLRDAATFEQVIGGLADKLGGAVGATRAAVDSGIAANELQVGQTGKIVAPDLYIAAGISGSTQHMAGIKDSKCIVAINKDPDAPIFEVADFGLVADLFDAVPELTGKV